MVVSIVALLVALLLPALGNAKRRAVATSCLSNLRQIGTAQSAYLGDFQAVPSTSMTANLGAVSFWALLTPRYMPREMYCPLRPAAAPLPGYGFRYGQSGNIRRFFPKLMNLKAPPAQIVLLAECYFHEPYAYVHYQITMQWEPYGLQSHLSGLNLVFADQHAALIKPGIDAPYIGGGNPAGPWAYSDPVYGSASNPRGYFYHWGQPQQY